MRPHSWAVRGGVVTWLTCDACGTEAVRNFDGTMSFLHPWDLPVDHSKTGLVSADCDETVVKDVLAS